MIRLKNHLGREKFVYGVHVAVQVGSWGHPDLIRQGKEEGHFSNRILSSRPEPRYTIWTLNVSIKAEPGIKQTSKNRAGGRRSGEISSVRWKKRLGWNPSTSCRWSYLPTGCSYLPTAGNYEVDVSRGRTHVGLVSKSCERVKHNFAKWVVPSSIDCWNLVAQLW